MKPLDKELLKYEDYIPITFSIKESISYQNSKMDTNQKFKVSKQAEIFIGKKS